MLSGPDFDEATADLLVHGKIPSAANHDDFGDVVRFLDGMRAAAQAPPAPVSDALASVLRDGLPIAPAAASPPRRPLHTRWRRIVGCAGLAISMTAGVTAAAAANLLPGGVERVVASVVKAVTPFQIGPPSARGDDFSTVSPSRDVGGGANMARPEEPTSPPSADGSTAGRATRPAAGTSSSSPAATPTTTRTGSIAGAGFGPGNPVPPSPGPTSRGSATPVPTTPVSTGVPVLGVGHPSVPSITTPSTTALPALTPSTTLPTLLRP